MTAPPQQIKQKPQMQVLYFICTPQTAQVIYERKKCSNLNFILQLISKEENCVLITNETHPVLLLFVPL